MYSFFFLLVWERFFVFSFCQCGNDLSCCTGHLSSRHLTPDKTGSYVRPEDGCLRTVYFPGETQPDIFFPSLQREFCASPSLTCETVHLGASPKAARLCGALLAHPRRDARLHAGRDGSLPLYMNQYCEQHTGNVLLLHLPLIHPSPHTSLSFFPFCLPCLCAHHQPPTPPPT